MGRGEPGGVLKHLHVQALEVHLRQGVISDTYPEAPLCSYTFEILGLYNILQIFENHFVGHLLTRHPVGTGVPKRWSPRMRSRSPSVVCDRTTRRCQPLLRPREDGTLETARRDITSQAGKCWTGCVKAQFA